MGRDVIIGAVAVAVYLTCKAAAAMGRWAQAFLDGVPDGGR